MLLVSGNQIYHSIDPHESSLKSSNDELEYRSLQVLRERLAGLQKSGHEEELRSMKKQ